MTIQIKIEKRQAFSCSQFSTIWQMMESVVFLSGFKCTRFLYFFKTIFSAYRDGLKLMFEQTIKILNGCKVWTENSVKRVTVRHHEAS